MLHLKARHRTCGRVAGGSQVVKHAGCPFSDSKVTADQRPGDIQRTTPRSGTRDCHRRSDGTAAVGKPGERADDGGPAAQPRHGGAQDPRNATRSQVNAWSPGEGTARWTRRSDDRRDSRGVIAELGLAVLAGDNGVERQSHRRMPWYCSAIRSTLPQTSSPNGPAQLPTGCVPPRCARRVMAAPLPREAAPY